MWYEVTIRDRWGGKIVRRMRIDDPCTTVQDILDQAHVKTVNQERLTKFLKEYGYKTPIRYFWNPTAIPKPEPPPEPPKPIWMDYLWTSED